MQPRKRTTWRKLDNAALLFSAASNERDPRVFRFYCEMKETVQADKLQIALEQAVERYPLFVSVMRKGLFWHYLEHSELKPEVREEYKDPCAPIYVRDKKNLLFEVTYYQNRINLEMFHALTDGTGATEFLRELVKQYILACHSGEDFPDIPLGSDYITAQDQENDSFSKYYTKVRKAGRTPKPKAFQLKKRARVYGRLQVAERTIPVAELLAKARALNVSMSVLVTAAYIWAVQQEMSSLQKKKPVIIMVPVNLRKFFTSDSMLNFFAWIEPGFLFEQADVEFETVLEQVKKQFENDLTKENMTTHINELIALEKHPVLKFFPLEIKNWGISTGARRAEKNVTAIFSNMGVIQMPPEYTPYIGRFGVYTSTPKMELTMCSFGDDVSMSFTSRFDTTNIQRNFFRVLEQHEVSSKVVEPEYPVSDTPRLTGVTVFKWFSFLCIAAAVLCVAANVMFQHETFWSIIAVAGIGSLWMTLMVGYYKRHNLLKDAMWQLMWITCGCMVWDLLIGWKGWSIDFVFPAASMAVMLSMLVIAKLQSHTAKEYMIYLLMAAGYSCIIPFILLLVGAVKFIYLSVICSAFGFLTVIGLMIFRWKEFKEEMEKNFHV